MSQLTRRNVMSAASVLAGAVVLGATTSAGASGEGPTPLATKDYGKEQTQELDKVKTTADFCKSWKSTIRPILVAADGILKVFYPPGAKAIDLVIAFVDAVCK